MPTVLIVDDAPDALRATARRLSDAEYTVRTATDGAGGLRAARTEPTPDLILLDVGLPDMSGLEVCRELKRNPPPRPAFIVLCSAQRFGAEALTEALAAADGFVALPLDRHELLARVDAFLRHQRTLDALRQSERRHRALFAGTPLPVLVAAEDTRAILAANPAASAHFGLVGEELASTRLETLFAPEDIEAFWTGGVTRLGDALAPRGLRARRADGAAVHVEVIAHGLAWEGRAARALHIVDITASAELDAERARQRDGLADELRSLGHLAADRSMRVASHAVGVAPLSESALDAIVEIRHEYDGVLVRALHERVFRTDDHVTPALRDLAARLFFLGAGPRDVTELHHAVLTARASAETPARLRGFIEAGRLTVLELMGHLVTAYRNHHVRGPVAAAGRP